MKKKKTLPNIRVSLGLLRSITIIFHLLLSLQVPFETMSCLFCAVLHLEKYISPCVGWLGSYVHVCV